MNAHTKLGGLPVWGWALIAVAGVGIGLYLRRRSSGNATSAVTPIGTSLNGLDSLGTAASGTSADAGSPAVATGIDPQFAQLLMDSNSELVNESSILAGLTGQSVNAALGVASVTLGQAADLFSTIRSMPTYSIAVSPAGAAPASSTSTAVAPATEEAPLPAPSLASSAPGSPVGTVTYQQPAASPVQTVDTGGSIYRSTAPATPVSSPGGLVDVTGHTVNSKGSRVGGAVLQ